MSSRDERRLEKAERQVLELHNTLKEKEAHISRLAAELRKANIYALASVPQGEVVTRAADMCREDARSRAQKSPPLELEDGIVGSIDEELAKCDTKVPLLSHFVRRLAMSDVADECRDAS
ncbi:hypothetical protein RI054_03g15300 [Pseudoscourfieldia marina]